MKKMYSLIGILTILMASAVYCGPNENAGITFDLDATTYGNQNLLYIPEPGIGDYIRLDVYAQDVVNLDTYEFEVLYDTTCLQYITAVPTNPITFEENILTSNGGTALGWMIDTTIPGVLSIAYTLLGTDTTQAPEGEGLIADIVFQAVTTGSSYLSFGNVYYHDSYGTIDVITNTGMAFLGEAPPMPPADLSAYTDTVLHNTIRLTWIDPTENMDGTPLDDLAGINVYYADGTFIASVNPGIETYAVQGLTCGDYYNFYVTAYDNETPVNESMPSNTAGAMVLAPMPPSDFNAYSDYTTPQAIQLTWTDPVENIDGSLLTDLNHIDVYYSDGTLIAFVDPGVETYTDDGLVDGQLYGYYLMAVANNGNMFNTTDTVSWHAGGSPIPSPPENLFADAIPDGIIQLTWNDPTTQDDGTPLDDLAGINIYYADSSFITSVEPGVETYTVSGLTPWEYYSFYITAYDNEIPVNESVPSDTAGALVIVIPPMPPADLTAYSDYTTPQAIQLTWTDPTENINGSPLTDLNHIEVYYSDSTYIASVNPGLETFTDDGLTDGQLYSYYLTAVDDDGNMSNPSDTVSWHSGGSPIPSPPDSLFAYSDPTMENSITLTWNDPTTQEDGTPLDDMAGINVYYADSSFITSVEPGVETYTVSGLIQGENYYFYVTAYDDETPINESVRSNIATCIAGGGIVNGDFETGDFTGWTVTGPHSANVVQHQGSWCGHINIGLNPASGSGTPNANWKMVSQSLVIPEPADSLNFYMELFGDPANDGGYVWIMDADSVGNYTLLFHCSGEYYPWEFHQVNIEPWAGHQVTISFAGHNLYGTWNRFCDIYFDNISLTPTTFDTIPPTVTVDVPNGGEVLSVGDTCQIQWTAEDDTYIRGDSVFYSIDNGASWIFIASHNGNPQSCEWIIPNPPSTQCLVKVLVYDRDYNSASDESDAVFTITADNSPPTVDVIAPNGGESWGTYEGHTITWAADDNVGVVGDSVYYSVNNGADWIFIASHTGNPQSFTWQVPNTPSEQCLVKVKVFDFSGNCTEDISDGNFTIFVYEGLINGNFETGDFFGWTVTGPHSAEVIQHQGSWCGHIHIGTGHASGQWTPNAQWEMVSQLLNIPGFADSLNFYMEVSGTASWQNGGSVWIMDADSVYTRIFHSGYGPGGYCPWGFHQVNIEPWAGNQVTISFAGHNYNGWWTHFYDIYFDDISISFPDTIPPTITVDVPNGGEVWTVGETYQIQWTAEDDTGILRDSLFYSIDNGVNWIFIASHIGNPQNCSWTIPNTPSTQCLVKVVVYDSDNYSVDESDAVFTITPDTSPPNVDVIAPNGGESWGTFEWHTITWAADDNLGVVGDSIYYSTNDGADWIFIVSHTGNPQSYSWLIHNTPSEQCLVKVKVFDSSGNYAEDISDGNFTIYYQEQTIINSDFETGDFSGWTVTGPHSADVIQHQGSWCGHINIGWCCPSGGTPPNDQWEMVSQTIFVPEVADSLNFYMQVSGSAWHDGGSVWIMDVDSVGNYSLLYNTGGGGGSGQSYPWEFHQVNIEPWAGHQATIYFAGQNSNGYGDHPCDIYFDNISLTPTTFDTIPPTVTINVPDGGEVWTVGETQQIQWTAEDDTGIRRDSVFYSIDNGANWIFIVSHTGNPQSCTWQVPNTPSTQCLVKVVVYDREDNYASDESDAVFTIEADTSPPTVEVIEPNGGESWGTFEWHIITWTADDNVGVVGDSVYYSINDGADWILIASHTGNPQSYTWQIPNTPSDQCLVKVKVFDFSGYCTEDISDGNFTIFYQEPPPLTYAVVIKQSSYNNPDWQAVVDALLARYQGQLFIWNSSLNEVQNDVATYHPTHIGFVCELSTTSPNFVQNNVWPFTRALDSDPYCDAVWGIITGYNAQDALSLVTGPTGFDIKTVLGGTGSCDLSYYTQGIATSECTYGEYYVKNPNSLETTTYTDGPTDRTDWLVTMINDGIDIFNYDPVDIFYTSGHANYNEWQLHYPSSGSEGYFRSSNGQVYGDPYSGANININSDNPKIYFGLGNCYIGKIINGSCMAPSWIHTGGAYQYTGYVIPEGTFSHQHGGTKAYFYKAARNNTWAESFFLANIALKFDIMNGTPGANPPDLNGSALYGDPGMQVKMSNEGVFQQPLFTNELFINEGTERDTVTFKITMNRQGNPGYDGKWGNRHPAIILPFRAENVEIVSTDAMAVVVEDNFALMYIWHQGQPQLAEGETREVVFTCNNVVGVDEQIEPTELANVTLYQNYPNPFSTSTTISFNIHRRDAKDAPLNSKDLTGQAKIKIYNVKGQLVKTFRIPNPESRIPNVVWDGKDENGKQLSNGIYLYRIKVGDFTDTKKCVILK